MRLSFTMALMPINYDGEQVRIEAARAWSIWEGSTSKLFFDYELIEKFADPQFALAFARIECHYFTNNCFFATDNYLVENVGVLAMEREPADPRL